MSWRIRSQALCNSLCNALHSARPQNPDVERNWWGARIRPRPPYENSIGGQAGSDPVPPRSGVEGSADGRGGAGTQQQKDQRRGEKAREKAKAETSTATAKKRKEEAA